MSGKRPGSAEALADDLKRWLRHEPIRARPTGIWERGVQWARRRPTLAALLALALVAPAVIIAVLLVSETRIRRSAAWPEAEKDRTRLNLYAADIYSAKGWLEHFNGMTGQPKVELLEPRFEPSFEVSEESPNFCILFGIHVNPNEVVAEGLTAAAPASLDDLRLTTHRAEAILQFLDGLGQERLGHAAAVIEPQRQQDLVASPIFHKRRSRRS